MIDSSSVPWPSLALIGLVLLVAGGSILRKRGRQQQLRMKLAQGAKVIDVRSPAEFQAGHAANAVNLPLDSLENRLKSLGAKSQALLVCCASGVRSARAAAVLRGAGFSDVTDAGSWTNLR